MFKKLGFIVLVSTILCSSISYGKEKEPVVAGASSFLMASDTYNEKSVGFSLNDKLFSYAQRPRGNETGSIG